MFEPVRLAFAFLTRLPVPAGPADPSQLGAAVSFFPLVGLVLGAAQVLVFMLLPGALDPLLAGLALVALSALATGALHLDGLADVFDGLGGGRGDRTRMLEIMRDPRIGAHGATALVLVLLGKVFACATLCSRGAWPALLVAPVCARCAAALLIASFPYARSEGLGRSFRDQVRLKHIALAVGTTGGVLAATSAQLIAPALFAVAVAFGVGFWVRFRAGGLTGDAYGAAIELSELALWIAARWS